MRIVRHLVMIAALAMCAPLMISAPAAAGVINATKTVSDEISAYPAPVAGAIALRPVAKSLHEGLKSLVSPLGGMGSSPNLGTRSRLIERLVPVLVLTREGYRQYRVPIRRWSI